MGHQADEELLKLEAGDLPGVGWSMCKQLAALGIATVADVRASRREVLQRELGAKTGTLVRRAVCPLLTYNRPCAHVGLRQPVGVMQTCGSPATPHK